MNLNSPLVTRFSCLIVFLCFTTFPLHAQEIYQAGFGKIGCGADANLEPRGKLEFARRHGLEMSETLNRALAGSHGPIEGKLILRPARTFQ